MKVRLPKVRLAFPALREARQVNGEGRARFGANLIVEPRSKEHQLLDQAIQSCASEKYKGGDIAAILKELERKDRICFRKEEKRAKTGEVYNGFEGMYYLVANNENRVNLFDAEGMELEPAEANKLYAGCYVSAIVDVWAQDSREYGRRINCTLKGLKFKAEGDAFGGGGPVGADEFEDSDDDGNDML